MKTPEKPEKLTPWDPDRTMARPWPPPIDPLPEIAAFLDREDIVPLKIAQIDMEIQEIDMGLQALGRKKDMLVQAKELLTAKYRGK